MKETYNNALYGATLAFTGFLFFSIGDAIVKILKPENISPFQVSFIYACCGLIVLLCFSKQLGGLRGTINTKHKKIHFLRALLQAPTQVLNFYAFLHMPLSNAYAVIFLAPFFTALLAIPLLKEKPLITTWIAIFLGIAGVLVTHRPGGYELSLPLLAVFATAVITAIRNIVTRKVPPEETKLSMAVYPILGIIVVTFFPTILDFTVVGLYPMALLALGGGLFGFGVLWTSLAFRYAPAAVAGSVHYSQLVWGLLFGLLLFSDIPDLYTITGAGLIALGGISLIQGPNILKKLQGIFKA